jgi:DNA-binding ferritin-like protein (Dps family)
VNDNATAATPSEQEERLASLSARAETYEGRRLSEHAYEQRRAMLIVALATFAMTWGGFRLSEVNVLGIKIDHVDEVRLLGFLDVVLLYTIGNFSTIAKPEFQSWQSRLQELIREYETAWRVVDSRLRQISDSAGAQAAIASQPTIPPKTAETFLKISEAAEQAQKRVAALGAKIISDSRETYMARLRWEYQVPIGIAGSAVLLTLLRIVLIGAHSV